MAKKTHLTTKIAVFLDIPGLACSRAISGLYRFARSKPDWRIFLFPIQRKGPDLDRIAASFNLDAIFAGHADAVWACGKNRPYVLLENVEPKLPPGPGATINLDNVKLGYTAAEKLHTLGYRNFGYLGIVHGHNLAVTDMQMMSRYSRIRNAAFERKVAEFCCPFRCLMPKHDKYQYDEAEIAAWLKSLKKPCGILAFSDEDAQYAISICRELRISVPKQIGIIGIDNEEFICDNTVPALTSIEPDYEGAGYRAGELLNEFLSGDCTHAGAREHYGVATVVNRMSAQSISATANRVARVLEVIRTDPAAAPSPAVLARQMNLSLRMLELAFKEILGHSITSEILSQRLALAKRLIKTSRLDIGEIALKCGFQNYAAFRASFKRRTGMSLSEWKDV